MTDCQLAHYLANISFGVQWFALCGVLLGYFGVVFSFIPLTMVTLPKWERILSLVTIISIVSIIISYLVIILVPFPKTILFGC